MRTFHLEVHMDNAAFENSPETELADILRDVAGRIEDQGVDLFTIHRNDRSNTWSAVDTNGNSVGEFRIFDTTKRKARA